MIIPKGASGRIISKAAPRKGAPHQVVPQSRTPNQVTPKVESFEAGYVPVAWSWFVDEALPTWVKKKYSPQESWRDKPFSKEDSHFFFRGIEELSLLFTEERTKNLPPYFQHPKYRSSYLLYFLPLQAAKFSALFQMHAPAIEAALQDAEEKQGGVLRVADFGAGPGTASLSLLLLILDLYRSIEKEPPQIEFYWFDTNREIMEDGKALVREVEESFGLLRGKVKVHTFVQPWWKAPSYLPESLSLSFLGHVLNESARTPEQATDSFWQTLIEKSHGGGVLWVEPAARSSSQRLSQLRDSFFERGWVEQEVQRVWGPCLHAGGCPLKEGRDWCHFSIPTHIPGKWFKTFSEALGSERQWVKFSYFWLASSEYPSRKLNPRWRRVVSDPLSGIHGQSSQQVLLCEPDRVGRMNVGARSQIWRGDIVKVPVLDSPAPFKTRKS